MSGPRLDQLADDSLGVVIIDHGSKEQQSNDLFAEIVSMIAHQTGYLTVQPAHLAFSEPTLATAFARCVAQGARGVVIFPYFLLPGRHSMHDIPQLARQAATAHPGIPYAVAHPLGVHQGLCRIVEDGIRSCIAAAHTTG